MQQELVLTTITVSPEELNEAIFKGFDQRLEAFTSHFQLKDREEYLTRQETADYLKVDLSTLYHWSKAGKLASFGIGNRVYYKLSDIEAALIPLNGQKSPYSAANQSVSPAKTVDNGG